MRKRTVGAAGEHARLRELVEAVSGQLRRGRPPEAIAQDLLGLGFDHATARRLVARVAGGPCRRKSSGARTYDRERARRLMTDALLVSAGIGVVMACLSAREHGIPLIIASAAILAGCGDAIAAVI